MSTRYRCTVRFKVSFIYEVEVDSDYPYNDAVEKAKLELNSDEFIRATNAKLEFLDLESHILEEREQ